MKQTDHDKIAGLQVSKSQLGARQYNERLILDLVRQAGVISKADIARITNLSAQSATVIMNQLCNDGFLIQQEPVRGKVGQPSRPYALNPDGAVSIGVKVGRRSLDVVIMSFTNVILGRVTRTYDYPTPDQIVPWVNQAITTLTNQLSPTQRDRLIGIGIAAPSMLDGWEGVVGAPTGSMASWAEIDLRDHIALGSGLPVYVINDATAACLAEYTIGASAPFQSMLYFYIGTFVGGGIVMNGQIYSGTNGNAGAVGSIPTRLSNHSTDHPPQLIQDASIHRLEAMAVSAGLDVNSFYAGHNHNDQAMSVFERWVEQAAAALAFAVVSGQAFLDTEAIVIDGSMSAEFLTILLKRTETAIQNYDLQGLSIPALTPGNIGITARAKGGAILPMHTNFALTPVMF